MVSRDVRLPVEARLSGGVLGVLAMAETSSRGRANGQCGGVGWGPESAKMTTKSCVLGGRDVRIDRSKQEDVLANAVMRRVRIR